MAENGVAVNGIYGAQYGQPAELAASTPSGPSHAPSTSQSTTASVTGGAQKADPTEIGWYFVEQYYTTLSKTPERIHLFYSKRSQFVTGNEAEKVIPAVGVKAISEKIKNLGIQDCKVRVLNVDSQASFSNIVVQVIGEMSNKNQPHHKFVQTFVLAEQPNGYFVLNDIFRYLSDDEDEIVEDEVAEPEVPVEEPSTPAEADVEPVEENVTNEAAADEVDEKLEENKEEDPELEIAAVNGDENLEKDEAKPAAQATTEATEEQTESAAPETAAEEESVEEENAPEPETEAPKVETATPAPAQESAPVKKTWANLLSSNTVPAAPAVPAKQAAAPQQPKAPRPVSQAQPPKSTTPTEPAGSTNQSNGWQMAGDNKKGRSGPQAKANDGNVLAYIKNVNEKVDARTLREVLERHGDLKYFDVSRPRNCAFVEFSTPEGYAAAVAANPHTVNTETIIVEERKPRPGAYGGPGNQQFARGTGQPTRGGSGRGGNMQQRTGSQGASGFPKDAGRGGFQQQRGGKSGTVTPRGRGQAQAA